MFRHRDLIYFICFSQKCADIWNKASKVALRYVNRQLQIFIKSFLTKLCHFVMQRRSTAVIVHGLIGFSYAHKLTKSCFWRYGNFGL